MAINWNDFDTVDHALSRPLLVVTGSKGTLSCGYLSIDSLERNGDAAATVKGVDNFDDMLTAQIRAVTSKAADLGVTIGMSGGEALKLFR